MNDEWAGARWFKAESSGDHGCVEVAFLGSRIGIRDTKNHGTGPVLAFSSNE